MLSPHLEPWRPSLSEYHRLGELGVFDDVRVELLDGVITMMAPPSPEHDGAIEFLTRVCVEATDASYGVRVQSGMTIGEGWEPQPDLAIVPAGTPRPWHPARAAWACEVAVSSVGRDRLVKRAAYARAGVEEYVIVVVPERTVEVHRDSDGSDYRTRESLSTGVLQSIAIPSLRIDLDALWAFVFPGPQTGRS